MSINDKFVWGEGDLREVVTPAANTSKVPAPKAPDQ